MTLYEVMKRGEVILIADPKHEHVISWDRNHTLTLWIETSGNFEQLETRTLENTPPNLDFTVASAVRLLMNIEEEARRVLYEVQPLPHKHK